MIETKAESGGTLIGAEYANGSYFADTGRHRADSSFKAENFMRVFKRWQAAQPTAIGSYTDVGCGSGEIVTRVAAALSAAGYVLADVRGYDVSPHVRELRHPRVTYHNADFAAAGEFTDLVTLFDVIEHIPDPLGYLKQAAQRCRVMAFHIPLDDSLNSASRNLFRAKLQSPGHLIFLDAAGALNLLALAGLRVVDYDYTFAFEAPSGRATLLNKLAYPLRWGLAQLSPWLLSKLLGGASLLVIALTPRGAREIAAQS